MREEEKELEQEESVQFQYEFSKDHVQRIREVIGDLAVISHEVYSDVLEKYEGDSEDEVKEKYALVVATAVIGAPWAFGLQLLSSGMNKFEEISGEAWQLSEMIGSDIYEFISFNEKSEDESAEDDDE